MKTTIVQYRTHPDQAEANAALIRDVMASLARQAPAGLHYQALRGDDGVTFTHVAAHEESVEGTPLTSLPEFQAFLAGLKARCAHGPVRVDSQLVGRYPR